MNFSLDPSFFKRSAPEGKSSERNPYLLWGGVILISFTTLFLGALAHAYLFFLALSGELFDGHNPPETRELIDRGVLEEITTTLEEAKKTQKSLQSKPPSIGSLSERTQKK